MTIKKKNIIFAVILFVILFSCSSDNRPNGLNEEKGNSSSSKLIVEENKWVEGTISIVPDFKVELLYEVPRDSQGTWVSLAADSFGVMYASDEYSNGIFRIEIGAIGNDVRVEKIDLNVTGAQGLTWQNGNLYANVNGKGLYKISGPENFDLNRVKFLGGPQSPSDHGNHALVSVSGERDLYVVNGNHTPLPSEYSSKVLNWEEDILLTRQWDANGHAAGIMAPGGYVARIDEEGKNWDILSVGYRNAYDMAIHPNGEMFTFDSDMEWDMGMPWYRPTRILQVVSGSDYGWRSGSGKWKDFYEDSHPSVLDVGPASPTGVLFGTGAKFPEKYQKAFFGLDWTYGTIYAFHLKPKGAGYTATAEEFLSGHALAVVDAVIGKDGNMYFITGGWGNDTKLYRVSYAGEESIEPVRFEEETEGLVERRLRRYLETFHGKADSRAVLESWPFLADKDRLIRNAARVAIEFQPVETWIQLLREETRPQAIITGTVALARGGDSSYLRDALDLANRLEFSNLDDLEKLGYLRALSLTFMRLGRPEQDRCHEIARLLRSFLPDRDERVNIELTRLLIYLGDSQIAGIALDLIRNSPVPPPPDWGQLIKRNNSYGLTVERMLENPPPVNKLEYLFMLRDLKEGWTLDQRKAYFSMINDAADAMGGQSYWGFLERMRDEALLTVSDSDRIELEGIISVPISRSPSFEIRPAEGPGREWTLEEAIQVVEEDSEPANFERGRSLFFATGCAACHRFAGWGGDIGPDLGSVGNRFSTKKILEDIIYPSANISDLYGSSRVDLISGRSLEGLVVQDSGFIKVYSRDPDRSPDIIPSEEVKSISQVPISQMPEGLINPLNSEELKDLIAYLKSGGDQESDLFK